MEQYKYHLGILDIISIIGIILLSLIYFLFNESTDFDFSSLLIYLSPIYINAFVNVFINGLSIVYVTTDGVSREHKYIKKLSWSMSWSDIKKVWWEKNFLSSNLLFDAINGEEKKIQLKRWRKTSEPMHDDIFEYSLFIEVKRFLDVEQLTKEKRSSRTSEVVTDRYSQDIGRFAGKSIVTLLVLLAVLILTGMSLSGYAPLGHGAPGLPVTIITGIVVVVFAWVLYKRDTMPAAIPLISLLVAGTTAFALFQLIYAQTIFLGSHIVDNYELVSSESREQIWRSTKLTHPDLNLYIGYQDKYTYHETGQIVEITINEGMLQTYLITSDETHKLVRSKYN